MKKVIVPSVIIVALAVAYYFVSFLPEQQKQNSEQEKQAFLFNKQTECKNICTKLYQEDKDELSTVLNPRYAYNKELNACFYSGGWVGTNPTSATRRVVNCQTNEEVLTYMTLDNEVVTNKICGTCVSSSNEYNTKEKEYMGE